MTSLSPLFTLKLTQTHILAKMISIKHQLPVKKIIRAKQMECQENTFVMKPQPPLSLVGVLRKAFKTTRMNGKLVLSILLLVFLSSSQLELGSTLALKLVLKDFDSHWQTISSFEYQKPPSFQDTGSSQWANQNKYTHNSEVLSHSTHTDMVQHLHSSQRVHQDSFGYMGEPLSDRQKKVLRDFLWVKFLILIISCVILLFFLVSTVSSSYESYTTKVMSLKDMFLKFGESWKRPIHTSFFLALISVGLFAIFAFFTGVIPIIADDSCVYLLYGILIIAGFFTYLHMANIWMLSLVVSVLETESSGLKAIDRTGELMKGKKIQSFVLMLLFHIAMGAVYKISGAITKKLDGYTKMAATIPFTIGLICMLKLFMFVVYTVFYHESKMDRKEESVKRQLGPYVPLATAEA